MVVTGVNRRMGIADGEIISLGGSGENGRNCFLLRTSQGTILLDCGVKREAAARLQDAYPLLDRETVKQLDAVLLSHAHEDHCAALPMLAAMGYRGKVYAARQTIADAGAMIRKWTRYAAENQAETPYGEKDIMALDFKEIPLGESSILGIAVLAGKSGHTLGSCWFAFRWGDTKKWQAFYSGDICFSSTTLAYDLPPACGAAVLDCANAGQDVDTEAQYLQLLDIIRDVCSRTGRVLLPVPASGRGSDLLLHCALHLSGIPIWAETAIHQKCIRLLSQSEWLKDSAPAADTLDKVRVIQTDAQREMAVRQGPRLFFTTDGMLTGEASRHYINHFGADSRNCVVLTGHAARGTPAADFQSESYRSQNGIRMDVRHLLIKAHIDQTELLQLYRRLGSGQVMLFHAEQEKCARLAGLIKAVRRNAEQ